MLGRVLTATVAIIAWGTPAFAVNVTATVHDENGRSVANAVVELVGVAIDHAASNQVPSVVTIDQRHETFIPLVSVVRQGGHVVFTNNDTTMHQVYSFSVIKQFEFEIDQGQRSAPLLFDKAGVAAIGCNIHDQMITYVYVAASPFAAVTDENGRVVFAGVSSGNYHAQVWHARVPPGQASPSQLFTVGDQPIGISMNVSLLPPPRMKPMHMGQY